MDVALCAVRAWLCRVQEFADEQLNDTVEGKARPPSDGNSTTQDPPKLPPLPCLHVEGE